MLIRRDQKDTETYSDLKFDLDLGEINEFSFNAKENGRDLQRIIDVEAVVNSLYNILATTRGSRLLDPQIDTDIQSLLFEPVNEYIAWFIAYNLTMLIPIYEPRVKVDGITITPVPENDLYELQIKVSIPSLNVSLSLGHRLFGNVYAE